MKMNVDCIRDVLLYLEENLTYVEGKENLFQHAEMKQYAETILMQLITNPDNMAKAGEFISKLF